MTSTQITNCEYITYNVQDAQRLDRFQLADLGVDGWTPKGSTVLASTPKSIRLIG